MEQVKRIRSFWEKIPDSLQWLFMILVLASVGTPFILLMQRIVAFVLPFLPDSPIMLFVAVPIGGVIAILTVVAGTFIIIIALTSIVMAALKFGVWIGR